MFYPKTHLVNSVYGISRGVPNNYVEREEVDQKLINNLTKDKHVVIYGSSKQGKTCLRKHCLSDDDYIIIHCSNRWGLVEIHSAILKAAGYQITQSTKKTASGRNKITASLESEAGLFNIIRGKANVSGEAEEQKITEAVFQNLELDAEDVNDIINALKTINFKKYIVLEDFHHLSVEAQKDFSVALKAFHEASEFCFIIIGVWLEENRLIVYNGDLTGRVVAIDADKWNDQELLQVINQGAKLLNIQFSEKFKHELIEASYDSVYIVQEVCAKVCSLEGIKQTQHVEKLVGVDVCVSEFVKGVVNQQSGRYMSFINQFAEGFHQETQLKMYKWLLYPMLTIGLEELQAELTYF